MPARETAAHGAGECLRLPCACGLCCDSIQAATCLLTNEVGLAPVSNREVTKSEVGLLPVMMQHVRYMIECEGIHDTLNHFLGHIAAQMDLEQEWLLSC